jgi:hypothetical protein
MLPVLGEADNRGLFRAGYLIVWRPLGRRLTIGKSAWKGSRFIPAPFPFMKPPRKASEPH